jgi:formamidopyrimidine-DNA glycosylase
VADEILYQGRLHPEQPIGDLRPEDVAALHRATVYVIQTSVGVRADAARYPPGWLFHYRWTGKQESRVEGRRMTHLTVWAGGGVFRGGGRVGAGVGRGAWLAGSTARHAALPQIKRGLFPPLHPPPQKGRRPHQRVRA